MDKQACAIIVPFLLLTAGAATAQTASVQSTVEAYGARLNNPGEPARPLNARRYNNRIDSRVDSRISLRIERFRVGAPTDPLDSIRNATQKSAADAYRNVDGAGSRATLSLDRFAPRASDPQTADMGTTMPDEGDRSDTPGPR
jgi:hypothetical protein